MRDADGCNLQQAATSKVQAPRTKERDSGQNGLATGLADSVSVCCLGLLVSTVIIDNSIAIKDKLSGVRRLAILDVNGEQELREVRYFIRAPVLRPFRDGVGCPAQLAGKL